jgi:hypothetical protein
MTARYIWCLIALNLVAIPVAIVTYYLVHRHALTAPAGFEESLRQRIASAPDSSQIPSLTSDILDAIVSGDHVIRSSIIVIDRALAFIAVIATLNLMFIALGVREIRRQSSCATNVA